LNVHDKRSAKLKFALSTNSSTRIIFLVLKYISIAKPHLHVYINI
jgi:hypothetical protein